MMIIPLFVFGAVAILLIVLFRRTRATSPHDGASYGGDTWTPMAWADGDTDSNCDSVDTADCAGADAGGGGDAGCDSGGGGCD